MQQKKQYTNHNILTLITEHNTYFFERSNVNEERQKQKMKELSRCTDFGRHGLKGGEGQGFYGDSYIATSLTSLYKDDPEDQKTVL